MAKEEELNAYFIADIVFKGMKRPNIICTKDRILKNPYNGKLMTILKSEFVHFSLGEIYAVC